MPHPSSATASCAIRDMLLEYLSTGRLTEVVYRDSAGQVCLVHAVVRDIFSRAGRDFLLLGQGIMLPFDHIITIDGQFLAESAG